MSRRKKSEHPQPAADAGDPAIENAATRPDAGVDFDPAESEAEGHAARERDRRPHGEPKHGTTRETADPNPFGVDGVSLTDGNDGPKMRFYRERRNPSLGIYEDANAIQFDAKPKDEVLKKLRDNGWSYAARHKVWKKPVGGNPATEDYKSQKLFREIANEIRLENGLEPVEGVGSVRT